LDEFRWILLGLGLLLIGGIWWWGARRPDHAPGNAELRESTNDPPLENVRPAPSARDWGVPPLEPLSIRTAEFERVPVLDTPMLADSDPPYAPYTPYAPDAAENSDAEDSEPPRVAAAPPAPNAAERQKIVTIRVCAPGDTRWSGAELMAALERHGLSLGRYQVFHRNHVDGRSLFCVASLVEPGTFDLSTMAQDEFRGVTVFAVLPGPLEPLETFDELFATARGLAEELSGMLQDAKGMSLSVPRAAALRAEVEGFQARLSAG
jgi:cell division protein ZipA